MSIKYTSKSTAALERTHLEYQAEKCLDILLHELPDVLSSASSAATVASAGSASSSSSRTNANLHLPATEVAAALVETMTKEELAEVDKEKQAVDDFNLQLIQEERQEIQLVLQTLRDELKHFPATVLLVFEELASQFI